MRVLGENSDSLSKDWAAANTRDVPARRSPAARTRTAPATELVRLARKTATTTSRRRSAPTASSSRSSLEPEPVQHRPVRRRRDRRARSSRSSAGPTSDPHFDAISFINSVGRLVAGRRASSRSSCYAEGNNEIAILDAKSANVERRIKRAGHRRGQRTSRGRPTARTIAFSGQAGGISDLYLLDLAGRHGSPADERPLRRHPADVVARRQDDRVLDRSRRARRTSTR